MWFQSGIAGPVVVHDDRVYFVQADQTITVLDLTTGDMLRRDTARNNFFRIQTCDTGLLAFGMGEVQLLDWHTLDAVWTVDMEDLAWAVATRPGMVLLDNYESVFALDTSTGETIWSLSCESGFLSVIAVDNRVMIAEHGDDLFSNGQGDRVYLVDITTGRILREHHLADPIDLQPVYTFDGVDLYTFSHAHGQDGTVDAAQITEQGTLLPVEAEAINPPFPDYVRIGKHYFDFGGKIAQAEAIDQAHSELRDAVHIEDKVTITTESSAPGSTSGRLIIDDNGKEIRLIVPHLKAGGDPQITLTDALILLSTSDGQVECIERETGRSRWLYVSQWNLGMISYTGGHYIDLSWLVRDFDAQEQDVSKRTPSMRVPTGHGWSLKHAITSDARVIEDPEPFDPYEEIRGLIRVMQLTPVVFAGVACVVLFSLMRLKRFRSYGIAIACTVLYTLPVPVLVMYCGVSRFGSSGLLLVMLVLGGIGVWLSIRLMRMRVYVLPSMCLVGLMLSLWWVWPVVNFVGLMWG